MSDIISIIVPVYNVETYIKKCIESIVKQTYYEIEIIIIDDGSTDNSGFICKELAQKDSRIIYIYQENKGSVGARKTGLAKASGEYVTFVDGDDYIDEDLVENLYGYIKENNVDFVHSNYMIDNKNMCHTKKNHIYKMNDLSLNVRINILKNNVFEWDMAKDIFECNLYGAIYKRDFITECYMSLPDCQQYGEDLLCLCNQVMKCNSMMMVPDSFYHYVMREGSLVHTSSFEKALLNTSSLLFELKKLLDGYGVYEALSEKCQLFFLSKLLSDFKMITSDRVNINYNYSIDFISNIKDKKVIIYGAGKVGRNICEQFERDNKVDIVGWVDKNYKNITDTYRRIDSPDEINNTMYDFVIVAVEDENRANQIIKYLIDDLYVDKNKIIWKAYEKEMLLTLK